MTTLEIRAVDALQAENERLKAALADYIARCPNCEGRGTVAVAALSGVETRKCRVCRWARDVLGEQK